METANIQKVMQLLPHRYPFLLVDRILELETGKRVVGLKNVTINEPFFQGHFPKQPIMPGVLIIEAMGQAGGVLAASALAEDEADQEIIYMGMHKVRVLKPVVPGDQLIFELKVIKQRRKIFKMSGIATLNGKVVAEAELMAGFQEAS